MEKFPDRIALWKRGIMSLKRLATGGGILQAGFVCVFEKWKNQS